MQSENVISRIMDISGLFERKNTYEVVWSVFLIISAAFLYVNIPLAVLSLLFFSSLIIWEFKSSSRRAIRLFNKVGFEYQCSKFTEAIDLLEQALELSPDHKTYNKAAAYIKYIHLNDYESAKENIHCCIMRNPCPEYQYIMADCHYKTGLFSKAIQVLGYIPADSDVDHACGLLLAKCHIKKGNPSKGIEILNKMLKDSNLDESVKFEVRYWLGLAYFNKDDFKKAREQLSVIFTSNSSYLDTKSMMDKITSR